jgi:3-dehydroquinate dehydratase II
VFKILLIHGPNLNMLGTREPEVYGTLTLDDIDARMKRLGEENGAEVRTFQSNSEGALIDAIQDAMKWADGIVINPGAYTHYSHAIRDALSAVHLPAIEVHLSNIYSREEFRNHSVISPVVVGCIAGLGIRSYTCGILALIGILQDRTVGSEA